MDLSLTERLIVLPISSFLPPPQVCHDTGGTPGYVLYHLFSPVCKMKYEICFSRPQKTCLPEHYVAGDHVHRAVLHHSLLGLVLSTIKGWCDQLSFLNNFCQFFRYLELIYLWCTLPIINSNGVSGQPSNTLHSVVMYAGIMFGFVIQTTQKPQTAFQWEGLPNSFISNQNSLYRTKELG